MHQLLRCNIKENYAVYNVSERVGDDEMKLVHAETVYL